LLAVFFQTTLILQKAVNVLILAMTLYEQQALREMQRWQVKMQAKPSLVNRMSKGMQNRMNRMIPEKVHQVITEAIKQMTKGLITGAGIITPAPVLNASLEDREIKVYNKIDLYRKTAAVEGGVTGAGGILLGLADFPLWLSIKIKMLLEIAAAYGYDVKDPRERIFILHIFQLSFASQQHRNDVFLELQSWIRDDDKKNEQPDWRKLQQEYRDYIDLAKLFQLVPGIGAMVGLYVNNKLTRQLGDTAMQAYRMRSFNAV
jgi:EcsC protein family